MPAKIPDADTYCTSGEKPAIYCKRCGETHAYSLPMSVDDWVKMVKAFNEIHAMCKKGETDVQSA